MGLPVPYPILEDRILFIFTAAYMCAQCRVCPMLHPALHIWWIHAGACAPFIWLYIDQFFVHYSCFTMKFQWFHPCPPMLSVPKTGDIREGFCSKISVYMGGREWGESIDTTFIVISNAKVFWVFTKLYQQK